MNLVLLILAANSLYGMTGTDTIEGAQRAIQHVLGPVIGTIFSIGLLASSLSSTSVGTYAGSEIMHGLLRIKAPMWACRVVTLVPALVVLWFANNPNGSVDRRPGRVVGRHSIRDYSADALHARPHADGGVRGRSGQARRQYRGRGADRRIECGADRADDAWKGVISAAPTLPLYETSRTLAARSRLPTVLDLCSLQTEGFNC